MGDGIVSAGAGDPVGVGDFDAGVLFLLLVSYLNGGGVGFFVIRTVVGCDGGRYFRS